MFEKSHEIYQLLKSGKDYKKEADQITEILESKQHLTNRALLQLACGPGSHDTFLKSKYLITGIDLNPHFITTAKLTNPECTYYVQDMRQIALPNKFDIVLCLYGAIAYLKTLPNVDKTLKSLFKMLNPNGILIVEPWYTPQEWATSNKIHTKQVKSNETTVFRMGHGKENGDIHFEYLVGKPSGISYFTEDYEFGLFDTGDLTNMMKDAGFSKIQHVRNVLQKRGLIMAEKV